MANLNKRQRLVRFVIVGIANTGIDFALLLLLTGFGTKLVIANMISTSAALAFSFYVNRSYTFQATKQGIVQGVKFIVVTLLGLWVLQPLVMLGAVELINLDIDTSWVLIVAKFLATAVTLVWNFLLYQYVVFPESQKETAS